jgi:hypothetical protein
LENLGRRVPVKLIDGAARARLLLKARPGKKPLPRPLAFVTSLQPPP